MKSTRPLISSRPFTSRPHSLGVGLLLSTILLSGCPDSTPVKSPPVVSKPSAPSSSSSKQVPSTYTSTPGCTGRRWVGVGSPPEKLPVGWRKRSALASPATKTLQSYHLYVWTDTTRAPFDSDVKDLKTAVSGQLDEDCVITSPMFTFPQVFLDTVKLWQKSSFNSLIGFKPLPLGAAEIRISVPDTLPAIPPVQFEHGRSKHGFTMVEIAKSISPNSNVRPILALPQITNENSDILNGGYFGTPVQLADAINQAVEEWKPNVMAERRLIINLSLGWQPESNADAGMTKPVQLVLDALRHAACHGVLVIAAAGNHPGGSVTVPGPIYPAAWQSLLAPTKDVCVNEIEPSSTDKSEAYTAFLDQAEMAGAPVFSLSAVPGSVPNALLYAVGGTNRAHEPMVLTRPESVTLFAAPATGGIAGSAPLPLTGTSVAAAVASGIAARVWAHNRQLTARQVMNLLYDTGRKLNQTQNRGCADHDCTNVREVRFCEALRAISPSRVDCTVPRSWSQFTPVSTLSQTDNQLIDQTLSAFTPISTSWLQSLNTPLLQSMSIITAPQVDPQPFDPACGTGCILDNPHRELDVSIVENYPYELQNMTLLVKYIEDPNDVTITPTPQVTMIANGSYHFENLPLDTSKTVKEATLYWGVFDQTGYLGSLPQGISHR